MGMNDDLKVNFDNIKNGLGYDFGVFGSAFYESVIEKITKDIADRQDREVALEFTKCICELLKKNGVAPMIDEYKHENTKENSIEYRYGVMITGLDFTEHDNRFKYEITRLKHDTKEMEDEISKLESELEVKDNLLKIKNGLIGNSDELPIDPMEVAQMLINSTYECESSNLEKALFKCGDTRTTERYSIDDLEQIAEHLLVYCKHHREDEE